MAFQRCLVEIRCYDNVNVIMGGSNTVTVALCQVYGVLGRFKSNLTVTYLQYHDTTITSLSKGRFVLCLGVLSKLFPSDDETSFCRFDIRAPRRTRASRCRSSSGP